MPLISRERSRLLKGQRVVWECWFKGNCNGVGTRLYSWVTQDEMECVMGKKMRAAVEKLEPRAYPLREAVEAVKRSAYTKFDESVDLALRLGVDPKRADQLVRGTTSLPHGTGKKIRVLVF